MTQEILKVHLRSDNIKYIIIPKKSPIQAGEYVMVSNDIIKKEEHHDGKRSKGTKV